MVVPPGLDYLRISLPPVRATHSQKAMKKRKAKNNPSRSLVPFAPSSRPLLPSGRKAEKEFIAYRQARKIDGTKSLIIDLFDFIAMLKGKLLYEKAYLEERVIGIQSNQPENIDQIQTMIYELEGVLMKEALVINHPLVKGRNLPTETESEPKPADEDKE